jgi:transcriptional regulator with XRE-family HTH domain
MNTKELALLRSRVAGMGLSAKKIAQGSGLRPEWVQKFRRGEISDPGVLKICALRDWLERVERGEVTP